MTRLTLLLLALAAAPVAAQPAHLRVEAPAGDVLVDGARVGPPGAWVAVDPGERQIALVDDAQAWDPRRVEARVALAPGDSLSVPLALPVRVRVETLPIRSLVVRESAAGLDTLGRAPLDVDLEAGEEVALVASRPGYEPVRRTLRGDAAGLDGPVTLVLPLSADTVPEAALLPTERSTVGRTLVDVGIGVAALAAGAVAVHYKFRADAVDDRYRAEGSDEYGDEALRQEALRLDRYSAAALGAMQVGVGVLAIRFVLR